jgi:hypothetical protein
MDNRTMDGCPQSIVHRLWSTVFQVIKEHRHRPIGERGTAGLWTVGQ